MAKLLNFYNKNINGLQVLGKSETNNRKHAYWKVKCICGKIFETRSQALKNGIKSCGCIKNSFEDLSNTRSKKLLITDKTKIIKRTYYYYCICDCGKEKWISRNNLRNFKTKSCGCIVKESAKTHGLTKHYLYSTWTGMKGRCYCKNNPKYKNYGERGIKICDRWIKGDGNNHGFICFLQDMGDRPLNYSLDRINVDGNYCKENCRWANSITQSSNKRVSEQYIKHLENRIIELEKLLKIKNND